MLKRSLVGLGVGVCAVITSLFMIFTAGHVAAADDDSAGLTFANSTGQATTVDINGTLDRDGNSNPFFQDLGTNGRSCVTCHQPSDGWTITPAHVQARFSASRGLDPIFASNDGS